MLNQRINMRIVVANHDRNLNITSFILSIFHHYEIMSDRNTLQHQNNCRNYKIQITAIHHQYDSKHL